MGRPIVTTGVQGFGSLPRLVRAQAGEASLERLFEAVEVPLTLLDRPEARLPLVDMATIFDAAGALLGDPLFGLTVGRAMQPEDYGVWVRYAAAAPTLGRGLARVCRAVRYYQASGSMRGEVYGDFARLAYYQLGIRHGEERHHADHVLPSLIGFGRGFLGQGWQPLWVEVPYAATVLPRTSPTGSASRFATAVPAWAWSSTGPSSTPRDAPLRPVSQHSAASSGAPRHAS